MTDPTQTIWWKNEIVVPATDWVFSNLVDLAKLNFDDRYQSVADYVTDHLPADVGERWATNGPDEADDITFELFHTLVDVMLKEFVSLAVQRAETHTTLANTLAKAASEYSKDYRTNVFVIPVTADQ